MGGGQILFDVNIVITLIGSFKIRITINEKSQKNPRKSSNLPLHNLRHLSSLCDKKEEAITLIGCYQRKYKRKYELHFAVLDVSLALII